MSAGFVDVCLEGILTYPTEKNIKIIVEVTSLSFQEATVRIPSPIPMGQEVLCVFHSDPRLEVNAKISRYLSWNETPQLAILEFLNVTARTKNALQQIMDYYSQLKKAGVNLGDSTSLDGKRL